MLSHERQLLDCDYSVHGAHEGPSASAFAVVPEECCYHGKDHAVGKQDQDPVFR